MTKILRSFLILAIGICVCGTVFAAEPVHRNIDGEWVPFDFLANPGYDETKPDDVVYYPGTDNPAFAVTYQDVMNSNGIGFDHSSYGSDRRARVVDSLTYIAGVISGETNSADIHFNVSQTDGSGALASCGTYYWGTNAFQGGFVFDHIKTGVDPYAGPDASATVDFGWNWYAGTGTPGGAQFDLLSVMIHEMTHALGFCSLIAYPTGFSEITGTNPGAYSYYDLNLENGYHEAFCDYTGGASFIRGSSDLTGVNGGVYFMGPAAGSVWGTGDPPIYAPFTWENGSSISHWALTTPIGTIMRPSITNGQTKRVYEDFEIGSLSDIGYDIGSVPTDLPATGPIGIAALLGVLGMLMGVSRKRR
ncbi:hypothetical protein K8T06_02835 [bacterium]|nr:hypothetical protein [bacterium]